MLRGAVRRFGSRRAVASVLAMMFVVLFGTLGVAMAIMSQGNMRTAHTHLHVLRAMGGAETGLAVALRRFEQTTGRFYATRGQVDGDFGQRLWDGTYTGGDGVRLRNPSTGDLENVSNHGIVHELAEVFGLDVNIVGLSGLPDQPVIHDAPPDTDPSVYRLTNWLTTPAVAISEPGQSGSNPAAYQITFAPLANGTDVRIIATGYSAISALGSGFHYSYDTAGETLRPLTRVVSTDVRVAKQHKHSVLSPSRIMIGKNVQVIGNLGARFDDVDFNHGHPIQIRSDFYGLDPVLDDKLEAFYLGVLDYDVTGDNRLRVGHPVESQGIPGPSDWSGDGLMENAHYDVTGNGYVDEFDIFIIHYDQDGDGRVHIETEFVDGEGNIIDPDLALLIDSANPDRNGNGVAGYDDPENVALGWMDGYIDRRDQYAKVHGRLAFRVPEGDWTDSQGAYQQFVKGVISPERGEPPVQFDVGDEQLPEIGPESFTQTPLKDLADGAPFWTQVAQQLGVGVGDLPNYVETSGDPNAVRYWRRDLDPDYVYSMTGMHIYERMPFNSPAFSDWYYRPRFENMVFKNVRIPMGLNALFVNCTFVGVTHVRTYTALASSATSPCGDALEVYHGNTHPNWTLYGKMEWSVSENRPVYVDTPLDKSDFLRWTTCNIVDGPANYDEFPDPPVINGQIRTGEDRDTKKYSNNIRFHSCLIVGSIVSDTPHEFTHVRNKLQFTGSTRIVDEHPDEPNNPDLNPSSSAMEEISKSSLMAPHYSVDIGTFNSPTDHFVGGPPPQDVRLNGTIVAGVLDARGNTVIDGTMLMTYRPVHGEGPMQQFGAPIGNPSNFNITLGYFGPEDGDGESLDPETLPVVDGQRIVGWDITGDGLADIGPHETPPPGATPVWFYGYGRIVLRWNPDRPMPDGILLPISTVPLVHSYREGRR